MGELEVLVALHDGESPELCVIHLSKLGYVPITVSSKEELFLKIQDPRYVGCVMDLNYRSPGADNFDAANTAYAAVQKRVESGEFRFLGTSAHNHLVDRANSAGISSCYKVQIGEGIRTTFPSQKTA